MGSDTQSAIEVAIDRCIKEGVLVDFFGKRREEVMKAMELDFTFGSNGGNYELVR